MEFRFRAGEPLRPSAAFPLPSPPISAVGSVAWIPAPPPPTLIHALHDELNHVRNREEILTRMIEAEHRILEEEVLMELNAERRLMMSEPPPFLLVPPPSDWVSDPAVVRFVPLPPRRLLPSPDPLPPREPKRMRSASAAKGLDAPMAATKAWGCAVCDVSATSEEGLREHLRGKKHMAKAKTEFGSSKAGKSSLARSTKKKSGKGKKTKRSGRRRPVNRR